MSTPLVEQLKQLPAETREALARYNFDERRFLRLAEQLRAGKDDDGFIN